MLQLDLQWCRWFLREEPWHPVEKWNKCISDQLCSFASKIRTVWDSEDSQTFPSNGTIEISIQKSVNKHIGKTVGVSNYISCCWENPNNQMIQYVIKSPLNKTIVLRLCLPWTVRGAPHVFVFFFPIWVYSWFDFVCLFVCLFFSMIFSSNKGTYRGQLSSATLFHPPRYLYG